jgi:hypothetical protein
VAMTNPISIVGETLERNLLLAWILTFLTSGNRSPST